MVSGVVCMLTDTFVEHHHSDVACMYITNVRMYVCTCVCVLVYVCVSSVTHVHMYVCGCAAVYVCALAPTYLH